MAEHDATIQRLFDLTGRVALVTGGGGHLGRAAAHALAEAGANVVVTSRHEDRAWAAATALPSSAAAQHLGIALNHLDEASVKECFARVVERYGRVDVLINNAYENASKNWDQVSAEQFNRELTNATGYFLLARFLRQHAVEHGRSASIVMVASMYGLVGSYPEVYKGLDARSVVGYHALKGGVIQLTRHLAVYWAPDRVRVNSLSPGPFPKPGLNPEFIRRLCEKIPMGRIGEPRELKGAILFLASDASSYMTGQNLVIDGGWTAW